jgi:hypothetical protein
MYRTDRFFISSQITKNISMWSVLFCVILKHGNKALPVYHVVMCEVNVSGSNIVHNVGLIETSTACNISRNPVTL